MKKTSLSCAAQAALLSLFVSTPLLAAGPHWEYEGHAGPEHWGELDPAYAACAQGKNQSPIDLTGFIEAELAPLGLSYTTQTAEILNNGHTVQANFAPGSKLTVDGREFELKQVHFHAPSENQIQSKSYAMEAHLVHADANGALAVVAVMIEPGAENAALKALWENMPEKEGDKNPIKQGITGEALLPKSRDYYRFNGSLTTPPCSEGVRWLVMKNPITASQEQIDRFTKVMGHPNNRPLNPTNARPVLQ